MYFISITTHTVLLLCASSSLYIVSTIPTQQLSKSALMGLPSPASTSRGLHPPPHILDVGVQGGLWCPHPPTAPRSYRGIRPHHPYPLMGNLTWLHLWGEKKTSYLKVFQLLMLNLEQTLLTSLSVHTPWARFKCNIEAFCLLYSDTYIQFARQLFSAIMSAI